MTTSLTTYTCTPCTHSSYVIFRWQILIRSMYPLVTLSLAAPSMLIIPISTSTPILSRLLPPSTSNGRGDRDSSNKGNDGGNDFPLKEPSKSKDENPQLLLNLAEVLLYLSNSIVKDKSTPKIKQIWAYEPNMFNGSNSHKLNAFILSNHFYFCNNCSAFSNDSLKINFALSFLQDTALQ